MNILTIDNVRKVYTERKLLDGASFSLQSGEKVGIIGINGTGKSTLLKIIAGLEEPDGGEVIRANNIVIHYLPQMPDFAPEETALEGVLKMALTGSSHKEESRQEHEMWELESSAKSMLTQLGVTDFGEKTGHLSGGQRKRLALAAVLLTPCDILVLDEPTNHLDSEMADWLEAYLKGMRGTLVMVTHDRYFLDSVCNRIVEIDKGQIYSYQTNYSGFLLAKQEREEIARAGERKRQSILRKEIAWMQRGARARSTKQKAHIARYEALRDAKGIEAETALQMSSVSARMGKSTVELANIHKAYGEKTLIEDFSYIFLKDDRIGFVGKNGCGKTTLMKIIDNRIQPDSGTVSIGQTIKIGYYTQEIEENEKAGVAYMDPAMKVIDYIKDTAEYVRTTDGLVSASAMLERFLFPPEEQYSRIGKLSGGEKRRLNLLRVLMEAPNVLILDEPTNDLDITTLAILEDYLDSYEGIVITVSHDRYFLDRTIRRIFAFEEGGILRQYEGGYTDYIAKRQEERSESGNGGNQKQTGNTKSEQGTGEDSKSTWKHEKKLKFTYQEKKEYEFIEDEIGKLEERLEEIDLEMEKFSSDFVKLNELTAEKTETENLLEEKMDRWAYLEELAAKIQDMN